jgi:hypothetical protein
MGGRSRENAFGPDRQAAHGKDNTAHSKREVERSLSEGHEKIIVI